MKKQLILLLTALLVSLGVQAEGYTTLPAKAANKVVKLLAKRKPIIITNDPVFCPDGRMERITPTLVKAEAVSGGFRFYLEGTTRQNVTVKGYLDLTEVWIRRFDDRGILIGRKLKLGEFSKQAKEDKRVLFWDDIDLTERAPEFLPNNDKLLEFVRTTMRYPNGTSRKEFVGSVGVKFIITPNGEVRDPWIVEPVAPEQDNEVLRVISLIPSHWKPAFKEGRYIQSEFYLRVPVKNF